MCVDERCPHLYYYDDLLLLRLRRTTTPSYSFSSPKHSPLLHASRPLFSKKSKEFSNFFSLPFGKGNVCREGEDLTIITYGVFRFFPENRVVESFTERGPTPIAVVFLFYWSWVILSWKKRLLIKELSTLKLEIIPPDTEFRITVLNVQGIIDNIYRISENPSKHTLLNRIHLALFNLQNLRRYTGQKNMIHLLIHLHHLDD